MCSGRKTTHSQLWHLGSFLGVWRFWWEQEWVDQIHSPCSEITPTSAGSSSDLRCCGLACLRRDMLLLDAAVVVSVLAMMLMMMMMLMLLRPEMSLRFADTSAKSEWINSHTRKKFVNSLNAERQRGQRRWRRERRKYLKLAGAAAAAFSSCVAAAAAVTVRWIAHVGIIIMIVNNAPAINGTVWRWGGLA